MDASDEIIVSALKKGCCSYILLKVGSASSPSVAVVAGDLDYLCINTSEASAPHSSQLRSMTAFSEEPSKIGFEPKWPIEDAGIATEICASLGEAYRCFFRFGPLPENLASHSRLVVHFAGPISGGDFQEFSILFPVLSYMFVRYGKCLLGGVGAIRKECVKPDASAFCQMLLSNCDRAKNTLNKQRRIIATQKIHLLREVWRDSLDPYHNSRIEARNWSDREHELVDTVAGDPLGFLRSPVESRHIRL